jgi:hypothetical protein
VASAPEQLALLVLAHLLPTFLDHAAHWPCLGEPRDGGRDWLVAQRLEVNAAPSETPFRFGSTVLLGRFQFRGRNSRAHHLDFFVIVS